MELRAPTSPWLTLVVAAAVLTALAAPARSQDSVAVPGTSVRLTPPQGFSVKGRGLENSAGSTITVSERSADSYREIARTFASAKNLSSAYEAQGVTVRAVREIAAPSGAVLFGAGTQSFRGKNSTKYFALFKGDKTVLLTFTIADRTFTEADAETLIRSVSLTPAPTVEEQLSGLPFTFELVEPFRVLRVRARDTVTLASGDEDEPGTTQPVIVIGRGQSRAVMGDEPRMAVEILKSTAGFSEAVVTAEGPAPFGGGTGYAVTAVVGDRTVVQYLRIVPGGAYLRFLARGPTTAMQAAETTIAQVASSVEPR